MNIKVISQRRWNEDQHRVTARGYTGEEVYEDTTNHWQCPVWGGQEKGSEDIEVLSLNG